MPPELDFVKRGNNKIYFAVNIDDPSAIDQLGFIIREESLYNTERTTVSSYEESGVQMGVVELTFEDGSEIFSALADCNDWLSHTGKVQSSKRGALQRSDPGARLAKALADEIRRSNHDTTNTAT